MAMTAISTFPGTSCGVSPILAANGGMRGSVEFRGSANGNSGGRVAEQLLSQSWVRGCARPGFSWRHGRRSFERRFFRAGLVLAISSNDFRTGTAIELDGAPWKVIEFLHVKPGKGAAFVRTKLRNYVTGNTVDKTFRAGEQVADAVVDKDVKQFSYMDGEQYVFMDMETYEEARLSANEVGDRSKYLKEGMECSVLTWNGRVIDMDLPVTVKLKVTQADPGLKGDTAQGGSKLVTVETGAQVTVPLFVNQDDTIVIQTKDGSYVSRG